MLIKSSKQRYQQFRLGKRFSNLNLQTLIIFFFESLSNTFMNFVPNKLITVDDKGLPSVTEKSNTL